MGKAKDFDALTEAQRLRDESFVNEVKTRYVAPLIKELEAAVPGYSRMDAYARFMALMGLNAEYAPRGDSLLLDFAVVGGGISENGTRYADTRLTTRGLVFSGIARPCNYEQRGGVPIFTPKYSQLFPVGGDGEAAPSLDDAEKIGLPLPYRVALVALYVRRNVFTTNASACLFAAGVRDRVELRRFFVDSITAENGGLFGWSVMLRDTRPENELLLGLGKMLRTSAATTAEVGRFAEYSKGPQKRNRDKSERLINFIDNNLPARGFHVGRSGLGKQMSWKRAFELFDIEHPGEYKNPKSFESSYNNAKARQKAERQ